MTLFRSQTARWQRTFRSYRSKIAHFRMNARLYLLRTILLGVAFGIYQLLFNFYALSLGYDEAILGRLLTLSSLTSIVVALPAGVLCDRLGRKRTLILSSLGYTFGIGLIALFPSMPVFYSMQMVIGATQSLSGVATGPFLMENSDEEERSYLFAFSAGLQTMSGFIGNWLGGRIPSMLGDAFQVAATSSRAYGGTLLFVAGGILLSTIPLLLLKRTPNAEGENLSPLAYARRQPALLARLIAPMLITSLGAGLLMPFINVFFRTVHARTDAAIGSLFAWGSLAMGIGLLLAPPLADRLGKIRLVVLTQALSIPFLAMLGFAPTFSLSAVGYLFRLALMNMAIPMYDAFVMEHVESSARATAASLVNMSWTLGWAFSPSISGWIQLNYGFGPVFLGTITSYAIAILCYWLFFGRTEGAQAA